MPNIIVKESSIEGKGVFAVRDFKKGEVVIDWTNAKVLSEEKLKQMPPEELKYVASCDAKWVFQESPAKYVNHCCEPSTFVKDFRDIALRDIEKGEEITSDYAKCPAPDLNMKSNCGSKNCRGIIKAKA